MLARCGRACVASEAQSTHAARYSPTVGARQRSWQQNATPLQSAMKPCVEVFVGLAAACDVAIEAANLDAVPSKARRARPRHCEVDMSACRCKNVLVSCMCRTMEMCVGVCIVGAHVRVLARARACVLRRRCRASLLTPETVRPFPSCRTTGPRCEREAHRHAVHCSRNFFSLELSLHFTR